MSFRVLLFVLLTTLFAGNIAFAADVPSEQVTVFFFHTNKRCTKCRNLEAYAKEAVDRHFADQIQSGSLSFKVVNTENRGNEHFVTDYSLITSSVVLVKTTNGRVDKWKNLDKIWRLVGDKEKYITYIRESIDSFEKSH